MKKTLEKIALIAHASISFIFVLLTVLILFNVVPLNYVEGSLIVDSIVLVLIGVLAFFYAILTAYLIFCAFNQNQLLKYVELYRDSTATVMATTKTIKKMATENAKRVGNVKVSKIRVSNDGKYGLILKVWLSVSSNEVSYLLDTFRCMCEDTFKQVLGLRFSSIDFKIEKISGSYQADIEAAQKQAKTLEAERKYASDCYNDPLCQDCDQDGCEQPTQQQEETQQQHAPQEPAPQQAESTATQESADTTAADTKQPQAESTEEDSTKELATV